MNGPFNGWAKQWADSGLHVISTAREMGAW